MEETLPAVVRVRQYDIHVIVVPGLSVFGEFDAERLEIRLKGGQPPQLLADTLMHELFHAFHFTVCGHKKKLKEEAVARFYSGAILELIKDNPNLIEWFKLIV